MEKDVNRPMYPEPIWRQDTAFPPFPKLEADVNAEVTVIGAGIVGITTAYLLGKKGHRVVLVDAGSVLNGTTGHTTAKVTIQHGLYYDELIQNVGVEKASKYVNANQDALNWMRKWVNEQNVDCHWKEEDAFLYTSIHENLDKLMKEQAAYEALKINGDFVQKMPHDFDSIGAVRIRKQAQFHPLKYLQHMLDEMKDMDIRIFENTVATQIKEGKKVRVITNEMHTIVSDFVVVATHFPMYWKGLYFARMYAERAYVIACKMKSAYKGGMYVNIEEPRRSIRSSIFNGEEVVFITGENHKTGQGKDTLLHYKELEQFASTHFKMNKYLARWSTQDLVTSDKVPYVGKMTKNTDNIFVATGFHKWGMTNGTAAAHLLTDLILGKENPFEDVVSPTRFHAKVDVKQWLIQNSDVAKHYIKGKAVFPTKKASQLQKDEGAIIDFGGERKGAYKCTNGVTHIVDTTCTHLGCELAWNSGDRTWDCPCHGSRFSYKGQVIEGPADKPLTYEHYIDEMDKPV